MVTGLDTCRFVSAPLLPPWAPQAAASTGSATPSRRSERRRVMPEAVPLSPPFVRSPTVTTWFVADWRILLPPEFRSRSTDAARSGERDRLATGRALTHGRVCPHAAQWPLRPTRNTSEQPQPGCGGGGD